MNWLNRIMVAYLVASTVHAPIPVFDGDNLKSGETQSASLTTSSGDGFDMDFILLGCDPPDDSDDGPVDDDPEDGSHPAFGPVFSLEKSTFHSFGALDWNPWERFAYIDLATIQLVFSLQQAEPRFRHVSFTQLRQSGIAHLRC